MRKTRNYKSLPYNPNLRDKAKALRKAGLLHEALLWLQIKSGQLNHLDFDRQKIIGDYIVDFYCAERNVVIEVDGPSHDNKEAYDKKRDDFMTGLGLTVIRVTAGEVLKNMDGVIRFLSSHPALSCNLPPRQASPDTPPEEGNL